MTTKQLYTTLDPSETQPQTKPSDLKLPLCLKFTYEPNITDSDSSNITKWENDKRYRNC